MPVDEQDSIVEIIEPVAESIKIEECRILSEDPEVSDQHTLRDEVEPTDGKMVKDDVPTDAPQFTGLVSVACKDDLIPRVLKSDWYKVFGDRCIPAPNQRCSIDLSLYVELYLNKDLNKKIVRLTAQGSGFSVGQLEQNDWRERGAFQDRLLLSIEPADDRLHMGQNSPRTENSEASFTSVASTSVEISGKVTGSAGKGAGGEGGGKMSYSVSNSVATTLSDFDVTNHSTGKAAKWQWSMTKMGGGQAKYTYPYDGPRSLASKFVQAVGVLPVARIATSNLFPACQAWWYAPVEVEELIPFNVQLELHTQSVLSARVDIKDFWNLDTAASGFRVKGKVQVPFGAVSI